MTGLVPSLMFAAAFATLLLAAREVAVAIPAVAAWLAGTVEPLVRAGSEGYRPTPAEIRRLAAVAATAASVVAAVAIGHPAALLLAGCVPGVLGVVVRTRRRRYRHRVEAGLPRFATAIADSVASGRSVREALLAAPVSLDGEIRVEAARLAAGLEAGISVAGGLTGMRNRVRSPRLDSLAAAILTAGGTGADLAGLLRHLAAAEQERLRVGRQARTATAQARLTGLIVVSLPMIAAVFVQVVWPGFAAAVLGNVVAVVIIIIAVAMQAAGFMLIRRMAGEA